MLFDYENRGTGGKETTLRWFVWSYSTAPVLLFSKLNKTCFGYFDPDKKKLGNENKYFLG